VLYLTSGTKPAPEFNVTWAGSLGFGQWPALASIIEESTRVESSSYRITEQDPPGLRRTGGVRPTHDQRHAQFTLQRADVLTDRRLGPAQFAGGLDCGFRSPDRRSRREWSS